MIRKPAEWMHIPTDGGISEALKSRLRSTLAVIGENIDRSRQHVTRWLSELTDRGLIEKLKSSAKISTGRLTMSDRKECFWRVRGMLFSSVRRYLDNNMDAFVRS